MKTKKRLLSVLLSLVLMLGLMPGMSLTAYAAPTETLLTTITATGKEQANYSTANVATVSFSYTAEGSSAYLANWGWWGYGWTVTVAPANGYTITKCVFYDDANRTATDSEAPFVVETTEEDKTPKVNGTPIVAYTSKGIKKIEVYGYATPAHTHDFTYSASGATITATCSADGCDLDDGTEQHNHTATLTIAAEGGTYDGTTAYSATVTNNIPAVTGDTVGDVAYYKVDTQGATTGGTVQTGAPTGAGYYYASVTLTSGSNTYTAVKAFTVAKIDPTAPTGLTATYGQKLSDVVLPTGWTWADSTQSVGNVVSPAATFKANFAGDDNYNAASNVDVTVTVSKADATTAMQAASVSIAGTSGKTATASYALPDGASYGAVTNSNTEFFTVDTTNGLVLTAAKSWTASDWATDASRTFTVAVSGATNYNNYTLTVTVTPTYKATQTITAADVTATYGDTDAKIEATTTSGGGTLSYMVKSGDAVTVNENTGALTIVKAGSAVITVTAAENDTYAAATKDVNVTVNTKAMTVSAENVNVYVDGQPHGITVNVTEPATGYTVKYGTEAGTYDQTTSPTQTEVGEKTVYYQVTADNYTTYTGSAKVTVSAKSAQTITASDVTATYGDTGKKIEASTTGDGGLSYAVKSGDAVTVDASGNLTIVKAGSAVITVTAAETDTYAQATKDVNVTVNTKAMTVSAEDVNVTVDGQAHGITVTVTDPASGATVKYGTEAGSYTLDASPTQTEVGEKTVYYQVTADNYTTYTGSAKVTITALPTYEVIYKVVNGTWSDDSTTDKKETVQSGSKPASVPTGMKAASGYTGGAWDTDPAGATITEATTFTYTFTAIPIYTVTVTNDGHGTGSAAPVSGAEGTEVTLNATPAEGYAFKEWQVVSGSVTVKDNKFTIGTANVEIKAVFEQAGDMEDEVIVEPGAPAVSGTNIDEVAAGVVTADEVAAGVKVWVDISPLAEAAVPAGDKALANQAMQGFGGTAGAWIDMSMFKQVAGQSKTAVHQTATAFRFSMKVPDSLKKAGRTFWLLRLHDDKADILATTKGDTLSGETDLFSTYLIAYKDAETPTPTPKPVPKTGDQDHPGLWILLMLIGIAGLMVIGTLKVSRKRK